MLELDLAVLILRGWGAGQGATPRQAKAWNEAADHLKFISLQLDADYCARMARLTPWWIVVHTCPACNRRIP